MLAAWEVLDAATATRKRLLIAGFVPIPTEGKKPSVPGWQNTVATEAEIDDWFRQYESALNTGVLTKTTPAIDIDVLDSDVAEEIEALAWEMTGARSMVRFGLPPKRAMLFRTDRPFKKIATPLFSSPSGTKNKVEILGDGQQVVVFGTHPDTGRPYSWHGGQPGEVARADLPELTEAMAIEFAIKAAEIMRTQPGWTEERKPANGVSHAAGNGGGNGSGPNEFDSIYGDRARKWALAALQGCADELAGMAPNSGRNNKLNAVAFRVGTMCARQWISRDEVTSSLLQAAVVCRLVADDGEAATRATLESGLRKGMQLPHPDLTDEIRAQPTEPPAPAEPLGEWDAGDDDAPIPPRGWLLGNIFCRRFISSIIGDGGTGKSALRMAQLLSLATGRALTGEYVFRRCRVLLISLEDDADELRRRLRAACLHHGIERDELKGWLFLATPGGASGKLMVMDAYGRPVVGVLAENLAATIKARKIDIVSLDPFVKAHAVEENNNMAIDRVARVLSDIAEQLDVAVDIPHHVAKGAANPGDASRARGASSMINAVRLAYTLTPMSPEEGQAFGLSEIERRRLIRLDSAKLNITAPMAEAKWFRLVGVEIGNASDDYPNGDQAQTIEVWTPPDTFAGLSNLMINEILTIIDAGLPDGSLYSDAPNAKATAAWRVIASHCSGGKSEAACRQIIRLWVKSGLLVHENYLNKAARRTASGLRVDHEKRPS